MSGRVAGTILNNNGIAPCGMIKVLLNWFFKNTTTLGVLGHYKYHQCQFLHGGIVCFRLYPFKSISMTLTAIQGHISVTGSWNWKLYFLVISDPITFKLDMVLKHMDYIYHKGNRVFWLPLVFKGDNWHVSDTGKNWTSVVSRTLFSLRDYNLCVQLIHTSFVYLDFISRSLGLRKCKIASVLSGYVLFPSSLNFICMLNTLLFSWLWHVLKEYIIDVFLDFAKTFTLALFQRLFKWDLLHFAW